MKNQGKIFEENWRKSVPDNVFYYRFRDSSGTWNKSDLIRFTPSNIADCMLFDGNYLFLCELKSHTGKSIPIDCIEGNKTKKKQITDLLNASKFKKIKCYIIVFFSDIYKCWALDIRDYDLFKLDNNRKSIPINYFEALGENIDVAKLKTNFRYNVKDWVKQKNEQ